MKPKEKKPEMQDSSRAHSLKDRPVLMTAHSVCKAFDGNHVLKDVSFNLKEGEVVLLRGNNGSGKTTLLNILTGNLQPDAGTIHLKADGTLETFKFPRHFWQNLNPFDHFTPERVSNEAVGRTWQGVRLFSTQNLLDNIAISTPAQPGEKPSRSIFNRRKSLIFEKQNKTECTYLLSSLGLKDRADSSADKISLGQSKRIAIARAIRAGARILFLDEPFAGLDKNGIEDIMTILTDLAHNEKITLVIIEHVFNIPRVLDLAHTVWTLTEGKILEESPETVSNEMSETTESNVMSLLHSIAGIDSRVTEHAIQGGALLTRFEKADKNNSKQETILEIKDLVVRRGSRLVIGKENANGMIEGLNLTINANDLAVLQAPNGWGKTTLLEAIVGILPIEQGQIYLRGKPIHCLPIWERIQLGMLVLQSRDHCFENLTVKELFALQESRCDDIDSRGIRFRRLSSLSKGEFQKVMINSLVNATVGFFDEPFSALDNYCIKTQRITKWICGNQASIVLIPSSCNVAVHNSE